MIQGWSLYAVISEELVGLDHEIKSHSKWKCMDMHMFRIFHIYNLHIQAMIIANFSTKPQLLQAFYYICHMFLHTLI